MLTSLGLIFICGIFLGSIFKKIGLPHIIGMLISGIIVGPYCLGLLDQSILDISPDLRKLALLIIIIKAGLSLDLKDLKKVGRPAILMSFIPASLEIFGIFVFAPLIFNISHLEALLLGSVLGAVSSAVVIPFMVELIENNKGTKKSIPQMIMAATSCDNIFIIVIFGTFLSTLKGGAFSPLSFLNIPVSIITGMILGCLFGYIAVKLSSVLTTFNIDYTVKVVLILAISFAFMWLETFVAPHFAFSGLFATVSFACFIRVKVPKETSSSFANSFGKLWKGAEIILFVLVGAEVNVQYTLNAGVMAVAIIFIGLAFRSLGVLISLVATDLSKNEKLFAIISFLPKATVQAAIGSIALSQGLAIGTLVLSVSVLAIIITAPLGAFLLEKTFENLLKEN